MNTSRIDWLAPASMLAAFLSGLILASGHHLFYSSLAGTETPTGTYSIAGKSLSLQQLNTAAGTTFSFFVKSSLGTATSIAFAQAFWRAARCCKNGVSLKGLDSTYSLLDNLLGLFDHRVWTSFIVPLLLALIAWCIPIASIITPATLSVNTAAMSPPPKNLTKVPNFDFTSLDFLGPVPEGSRGFCYNGPSQPVQRVVAATAAQGKILPIDPPAPNTSWTLDFWGPALECQSLTGVSAKPIWDNILDRWSNVTNCSNAFGYLAWTSGPDSTLPFVQVNKNDTMATLQSEHMPYDQPASLFMATIPQMFNFAFMQSNSQTDEQCTFFGAESLVYSYPIADDLCLPGVPFADCHGQQAWLSNATLLRCDLTNSSYAANFNYTGGTQVITVTTNATGSSSHVVPHECFSATYSNETVARPDGLRCRSDGSECYFDATASKLLSYQSIAEAFNRMVLGSVTLGGYGTPATFKGNPEAVQVAKKPGWSANSSIVQTILMDTEELAFVNNFNGVNETYPTLQMSVSQSNATGYRGISDKVGTGKRGSLHQAVEALFANITISLLAEEYLQPNYSSPYAPAEKVETTYNNWHNVYVYSARTLWIAYGLAIFFTAIAVCVGLCCMLLSDASYSNDFSTILRSVRNAPMSVEMSESEQDGRQPLPKHLESSRITLACVETSAKHIEPDLAAARESGAEMRLLPPVVNVGSFGPLE